MAPKVYVTGATGFIGGDALFEIVKAHPDWIITCQVRNPDKGAKIAARYPSIRLVYGDLDDLELIEEEASKTDIVYHFANCDHEPSAQAISKGLGRRQSQTPGFWIHTSGTGVLTHETMTKNLFGVQTEKVYNDWDGISELTSLPDEAIHRAVDKIVLNASVTYPNVKTAIVCPPTIYGRGRGPDNQTSIQLPWSAEAFLKQQRAATIGEGRNTWNYIHVHDLSNLYLLLGEAAAAGGGPATWNDQGYYLAENGEFLWGDILKEIAKVAHKQGLLPSDNVESVTMEEADALFPMQIPFHLLIGTNSRATSIRAKKLLSWSPKEPSFIQSVPEVVENEGKKLGLIKGHAQKVDEGSK